MVDGLPKSVHSTKNGKFDRPCRQPKASGDGGMHIGSRSACRYTEANIQVYERKALICLNYTV